jgi:hypothetical protein
MASGAPFVRRAGSGLLPGGRRVTWTVADGTRGRRWRATTTSGDRLLSVVLIETDPAGRLVRLEAASPAGLLTLHPDAGGAALHGNVVRPDGVEHVALPWSRAHLLLLGDSPFTAAVAAGELTSRVGAGEGCSVPAVEVDLALRIRPATWRIARTGERRWRLLAADGGPSVLLELDEDGIPALAEAAETWPLERAAGT